MRISRASCVAGLALLLMVAPAEAQLRAPQVPIQGTALQQFFDSRGQAIDVATGQCEARVFAGIWLTRPPSSFDASTEAGDASLSLYNAGQLSPLFEVLPTPLPSGWHAAVTFADFPASAIVRLFDAAEVLQETTTHLGVSVFGVGLTVVDANGTFYSEDALNPGGEAHLLFFRGTGLHQSDFWLAAETDGDGDFADSVHLLGFFATVPVERASWGTLKQRFR